MTGVERSSVRAMLEQARRALRRVGPEAAAALVAGGGVLVDIRPVDFRRDEGYASSLAAANLRQLGLAQATDLDGGFRAWAAAGLPVARGPGAPSDDHAGQPA